ncbi:MAG: aminopeptidase P family N-terminal domain-containing protein [Bacteroidales bacterium]|nr:aminopeptidase P family N-terminal domain-containing protein [Bacteroidales bacterium]
MMRKLGWDAVVISGTDPFSSEYPADRWHQVEWMSGFTGEAGDLVITLDHAGLWTDSRYFIQSKKQLEGSGIVLHKTRQPDSVSIPEWLAANLESGSAVAFDGLTMSLGAVEELEDALEAAFGADGYRLVSRPDLLDALWEDRPLTPSTSIEYITEKECGESLEDKIEWLRDRIEEKQCSAMVLCSLDEIAWLLNVRGNDIEYNPYVISYLLVTLDSVRWYVDKGEHDPVTENTFAYLRDAGVEILPYGDFFTDMYEVEDRLLVDPASASYELSEVLKKVDKTYDASPIPLMKAVKNNVEIASQKRCYINDGLAMEKFLYWLETRVKSGEPVNEWQASVKLSSLRAEIPGYRGDSFENISAYGAGAALPHYITPRENAPLIEPRGLYLVDSGGHYTTGTTDITRTVPMGELTDLEKEDYTLVLRGMIDLSMAVFPRGTAGCQLDVLARNPLWQARRNFGHGTGHGIGFWLGVHEGPEDIRQNFNRQPLLPGMITSNEPGLYREGLHGVRHENAILVREAARNEFGDFLCFDTLTRCHIDTEPLVTEMMTDDEIDWLNDYNGLVFDTLALRLDPETRAWLREKTLPVCR